MSNLSAAAGEPDDNIDDVVDFTASLMSRKKKKKPLADAFSTGETKTASDRDYTYTELLERMFSQMREKNPSLCARKRHVIPPPSILGLGSKRVIWANFNTTSQLLHREPKHLQSFILAELGTEGSINGNQQLVIKGRYNPKQIEILLKKYINEYVTCGMCRNPETILIRNSAMHLYFLQCESCKSERSVAAIKSGYHAANRADRRKASATTI
ncbi:MAG: hypothetical protein Hyperionvirus28_31 [Hyperionvirus sp.]|uniref:Translation initiation factor IF2/IF5 domain-containing protein n=1 Tax=Hyperionvirus sp. TaxID=2487770 RepID=A0A3G5AF82_9VIRU|nr:MAG: hypothetical protein Hyperionvirus28_31 [Hyperionvirus sp.]